VEPKSAILKMLSYYGGLLVDLSAESGREIMVFLGIFLNYFKGDQMVENYGIKTYYSGVQGKNNAYHYINKVQNSRTL
jgi:hypothetical protein